MTAITLLLSALVGASLCQTSLAGDYTSWPWLNPDRNITDRVDALINALHLDEKCAQLVVNSPRIQRLGVPAYHWRNNILHGPVDNGISTMFPQAIGLGATWDKELLSQSAVVWAHEQRALHNSKTKGGDLSDSPMNYGLDLWGPNINLFVHPLWGRGQETYGEDPLLTGQLAAAVVKSLQERSGETLKTLATPKHFAAYTIDKEPPRLEIYEDISPPQLHQYYFSAFRRVVAAGAQSIMCSYNGISTVLAGRNVSTPMCMSPLLSQTLRSEMGFKGYIVTDSGAIDFMVTRFKRFDTLSQAAAAAIQAGVDLNSGTAFNVPLCEAVRAGQVHEAQLDQALRRVIAARIRMGLLDPIERNPFANISANVLNSPPHRNVALRAARASLVLVKNTGMVLPLQRRASQGEPVTHVAVIGPAAHDAMRMVGNYYGCSYGTWGQLLPECRLRTTLEAIQSTFGRHGINVSYARGSDQDSLDESGFENAIKLADSAEVVIAVVGLRNCFPSARTKGCEGEGSDRENLALPGAQHALLDRLHNTGKPLVIVLLSGGPVALTREAEWENTAILVAWYGGSLGARAIAETLLGQHSPSGRLPVTFPRSMGQVATRFGMDLRDAPGRTYRYLQVDPLFPFGFGLSFANFSFADAYLRFSEPALGSSGLPSICVTVSRGQDDFGGLADQVVMAFAKYHGPARLPSKPELQLVGFDKLQNMSASSSQEVCLELDRDALELVGEDGRAEVQSGSYSIFVGGQAPRRPGHNAPSSRSGGFAPIRLQWSYSNPENTSEVQGGLERASKNSNGPESTANLWAELVIWGHA